MDSGGDILYILSIQDLENTNINYKTSKNVF
jgi:hypothetical protein